MTPGGARSTGKNALITGITGQDGAYLAKFLLDKGYAVCGLFARRDWGFAWDFVPAMWLMLQHPVQGDYVVASGRSAPVRDFCEIAFQSVDLDYRNYFQHDAHLLRPAGVDHPHGDVSRARSLLGWQPRTTLETLAGMLEKADLARAGV